MKPSIPQTVVAAIAATAAVALIATVTALTPPSPAIAQPVTGARPVSAPVTGARPDTTSQPRAIGSGHVYYVDAKSGNDQNSGLTTTRAWKSLTKVGKASLAPGDVVAFKRGQAFIGSATISSSGTTAAPITFTGYGAGAQPTLSNPGQWNMLVLDAANLHVTNLGFAHGAVFDNSDGTGIRGPKYELSAAIAITSNGTDAVVQDSTFTDVGVGVKTYGLNTVIVHNSFHDLRIAFRGTDSGTETSYGAIGVSIDNSGTTVQYNNFINCRSTDSPYGADGGAVEIEGFDFDKNDISIDHNYSQGSQGFVEVTETHSSNVTLAYNVSDDYQQFVAWDTTTAPDHFVAKNNTVVRRHDSFNGPLFDIYYYREAGPAPTDAWLTAENNIFDTPYGSVFNVYNFPHDHNLFWGGSANADPVGFALGAGDLIADPQFRDDASGDLHPSPTSPANGNGAAPASPTDLDGLSTSAAGNGIGAYEYQKGAPTRPASLVDSGFESQTTLSYTSTPWRSGGSLYSGLDLNAGKAHSGRNDAWLASSGTGYWGSVEQRVTVRPHTLYRFTICVRNSQNIDQGWIGVKSAQGTVLNQVRHGGAADYTSYAVTFNSAASTSVDVFAGYWGPGPSAYEQIDDATLASY